MPSDELEGEASVARFNLIDLFAGVGGFTVGFRDDSAESRFQFAARLMVDIDPEAREVAKRNLPDVRYHTADVHRLSGAEVRRLAGLGPRDNIHVLVGGPPCQGFSWLGKRLIDDDRNVHLLDFLRLVKELRPLVAVMENVPLIITSHGGAVIEQVIGGFGSIGYSSCADVVAANEYGVPQQRKRAFALAYRGDLGIPPQLPKRTHERISTARELWTGEARRRFEPDKVPYVSVEEAIGDLPPLKAGGGEEAVAYPAAPAKTEYQKWARRGSIAIFNHKSRAHSAEFLEKISAIVEGGRNAELPDDQRFSDNYYSQAYARLHRSGIAQTVTTFFGNPGSGRFMHYRDLRAITVREAARFQSFPDWFAFDGHHGTQMRHVGNAVPPLMARALRDHIGRDLLAAGVDKPRPVGRPKIVRPPETPEQRSRIMRAVPAKNTSAEKALRGELRAAGLRGYRLHSNAVPGTPDVVFTVARVAVFVDGCFWHGCPECDKKPSSNGEYWRSKAQRNRDRDERVNAACAAAGWRVVRIWEHELLRAPRRAVRKVAKALERATKRARAARRVAARGR